MTKYPKEWLEALAGAIIPVNNPNGYVSIEKLLDRLNEVGALKEPPKPREFWMARLADGNYHRCLSEDEALFWSDNVIHVKEVIE